ncbi:RNA ligase [Pseudomonas phage Zigelbrucke]|uniref:Putative RNA ligase n=1 Tax=Pseudomonas phage Zigelbrucke TaxID=1916099 RepID=A0A1J0MEX7_9CAUD|nr:RNA ligase [Pseudomonas phage Zigelbrucke]APD19522.1 putative RNA ligase [Pseudomonas phage Zigelbrucke]
MSNSQDRVLARVVRIDDVKTHPNADSLDLALVGGWQCVIKRGEYQAGDLAIYIEVDSMVPMDNPIFEFLRGRNMVERDGKEYSRIKTMKLRKELSQGLIVPVHAAGSPEPKVDEDVTDRMGILKYVKPSEQAAINGGNKGSRTGTSKLGFPNFIPKTDQARVQNIQMAYDQAHQKGEKFEVTFKLDGSSLTIWHKDGEVGVASRNVGFRLEDEKIGFFTAVKNFFKGRGWKRVIKKDSNHFTAMAEELNLGERLRYFGLNIALQGELVAPNIQGNFEGVDKPEYYVYDIYNISDSRYCLPAERLAILNTLNQLGGETVKHVPVYMWDVGVPKDMQLVIKMASGESALNGKYREGLVFKSMSRDFSFKVISNEYLLKEE